MLVNRSGFTTSDWINLLKSELDLRHPIWYTGNGSVGHSFVCDGYQDSDFFHFNWGWSGTWDGYFYIGSLNPVGQDFNALQTALIKLVPGDLPDDYNGFFLASNTIDISVKGGSTSVNICSSINWTASSDESWLTISSNSGNPGKTIITMIAPENQTGSSRSAIITISAEGFRDQTINVIQNTKINVMPGGLYNSISTNAIAISTLTLTGTIDARDFRIMRDAMPALTDVDLSGVKIVYYRGSDGTTNGTNTYPANEIPAEAFQVLPCNGQSLLKSIILPTSTTSIGAFAFSYCNYLPSIYIPSSVTNFSDLAFNLCFAFINIAPNNPKYSSIDGVLFDKNKTKLIKCPISKTGNYTIPSSVTSVGGRAFEYCSKLSTVIISSDVTSIESYAFINCTGLSSISIPSSVTSIENEAFRNCSALINVDTNNPNYSSIDGVLYNKSHTTLIQFPISKTGNFTIPNSVTTIGRFAFSDCSGLKSIIVPPTVNSIEICAFNACFGLTNITIPSSIKTISYGVFNFCTGLKSITIPFSVNFIDSSAFCECSQLSSISVFFASPVNLSSSTNVFFNVNKNTCLLYVPNGSRASFKVAPDWKDFANIIEMPNQIPIANAGPDQIVSVRRLVSLNGTESSDTEGKPLNYNWIAPSGISLNSKTSSIPTFTAPDVKTNTNFTFSLIVNDGIINSSADQVTVTVIPNQIPTANAGPDQTVSARELVSLNGSNSNDAEGNSLTFKWITPSGISLNSTTSSLPTFKAPDVTTITNFTFSLIVNDGIIDSSTDQVTVTVIPNQIPIANAGPDQTVNAYKLVTLNGSNSTDAENKSLSYKWTAPPGITLNSKTTANPTFTAPYVSTNTTFTFNLVVSDGTIDSSTDEVTITIIPNQVPKANAGLDQVIFEKSTIILNGSASADPENEKLTYLWDAPSGIKLSSTTSAEPTFVAPEVKEDTNFTFFLMVNDGWNNSTVDQVIITVKNIDKAPYLKNPVSNISVDKRAPDQIIDLKSVFMDDDASDILTYKITSNSNTGIVATKITGSDLILSFSTENTGVADIEITAESNGKTITMRFSVEVKIPTGIDVITAKHEITIYPNPTNGMIHVTLDGNFPPETELVIIDSTGKIVLKQRNLNQENRIYLSGLPRGQYLVKTNEKGTNAQKIILK